MLAWGPPPLREADDKCITLRFTVYLLCRSRGNACYQCNVAIVLICGYKLPRARMCRTYDSMK